MFIRSAAWFWAIVVVTQLWASAKADALDIYVELFQDSSCSDLHKHSEFLLLDSECYAGTFSALTKAYTVKTVGFGATYTFELSEYTDVCHEINLNTAKRRVQAGVCERWLSPLLMAKLSVRLRSTVCTEDCSRLSLAVQTFYEDASCTGAELSREIYPVQSECLRYWNGTQTFSADAKATTVYQSDYPGSDDCTGDFVVSYQLKAHCAADQVSACCLPLFEDEAPRSVSWHIEMFPTPMQGTTSRASRRIFRSSIAALSSSATLLLLHTATLFATY